MEKLDKVIAGLSGCVACICSNCEYFDPGCESACTERLMKDALEWLKEQNRLIEELSENIPCCDNCEGKTVIGERTDKCVYEIEGFDSVIYCAKRGIENCFGYRKKITELEEKLEQTEFTLEVTRMNLGDSREECNRLEDELYEYAHRGDGDLISRSALLEEYEWLKSQVSASSVAEIEEHMDRIRRAPAVEAEPVVHAHWNGDCCSRCGELAEENYPRCPHCGAHMDEEVADGDTD